MYFVEKEKIFCVLLFLFFPFVPYIAGAAFCLNNQGLEQNMNLTPSEKNKKKTGFQIR